MKKFKIPIIIGLVVIILVVVNLRFDLIDRIIVQFSSEKYAEYVSEMDYEEALLKEPVCIKDMASEDRELTETELDKIIKPYDFHTQLNEKYNLSDEKIIKALAVAGVIGNVVKTNASISGAECGCQAEVGTACSMAAAALAYLFGGTLKQIENAAEIGMEHHLGLTCDPIY